MQILLQAGADVQQKFGQGESLAHLYAKSDRAALLQPIHAAGCNLDTHDDSELGETPLYAACRLGHVTVVSELIRLGVDVDKPTAKMEQRPMWRAARGGHTKAVRELLAAGRPHFLNDPPSSS